MLNNYRRDNSGSPYHHSSQPVLIEESPNRNTEGLFESLLESSIVKELHETEVSAHEYFQKSDETDPKRFTMVVEPWNDSQQANAQVKTAEDRSSKKASQLRQ